MRNNPSFDLFEEICGELAGQDDVVLTDEDFRLRLCRASNAGSEAATTAAVSKALEYLQNHFQARGSVLPFDYDLSTGRVTAVNREYVDFVADAQGRRSVPKESRHFEVATSEHMAKKLTGILRRVGSPRRKHKKRAQFAEYLVKEFGFRKDVLIDNDKDGGLDILWFPPLGAFPLRAVVSIQCKNSSYNRDEGFKSVGRAKQSLRRHSHATSEEGASALCCLQRLYRRSNSASCSGRRLCPSGS